MHRKIHAIMRYRKSAGTPDTMLVRTTGKVLVATLLALLQALALAQSADSQIGPITSALRNRDFEMRCSVRSVCPVADMRKRTLTSKEPSSSHNVLPALEKSFTRKSYDSGWPGVNRIRCISADGAGTRLRQLFRE